MGPILRVCAGVGIVAVSVCLMLLIFAALAFNFFGLPTGRKKN